MESATDQKTMIFLFLEIAFGQTADTACQFLQATDWKLEEALQLFYAGNEFGEVLSSPYIPPPEIEVFTRDRMLSSSSFGGSSHAANTTVLGEELTRPGVLEVDQGFTSAAETSRDNLALVYRPPVALMYHGSFEEAKKAANGQDKWLLVNVQSTRELSSHLLNLDTWGNETVAQIITSNFIFWQICDDTEEGNKLITSYKLDSVPATLVIDPITGQKMRLWCGMIPPETFMEDMLELIDSIPKESTHASPPKIQDETNKDDDKMKSEGFLRDSGAIKEVPKKEKHNYPALPEEPKGDKSLLCRVRVRFPDGSRVQRNFLRSDPIQLLWSFCAAKCGDEKPFRLTRAIPGAVKEMDYDSLLTFDGSGVANSMISVTWE